MLLVIALVLAAIWLACLLLFKVTAGAIHLILVIAVVAVVAHFVRRKAPPPASAG